MTIEFRCSNGHRLSCPDDRAGRGGKCPKCGVAFKVPAASTQAASTSDSAVRPELQEPVAEGSKPGLGSGTIALASFSEHDTSVDDQIVFLCPNGHKLTCSPSLQGKPGKCPHCGTKFLIPDYSAGDDESGSSYAESPNGEFAFDFSSLIDDAGSQTADVESHSMARLFSQLWRQKAGPGTIELYLKGGERLAPEHYAPGLSRESYGMFAVQDQDGRYTLTAINWDAIERVAVRGVEGLPKEMFEAE